MALLVALAFVVETPAVLVGRFDAVLEIAPWEEADRIDYLLARHPRSVRSVMERLKACECATELEGSPRLWVLVLDQMAARPELKDVRELLRQPPLVE